MNVFKFNLKLILEMWESDMEFLTEILSAMSVSAGQTLVWNLILLETTYWLFNFTQWGWILSLNHLFMTSLFYIAWAAIGITLAFAMFWVATKIIGLFNKQAS